MDGYLDKAKEQLDKTTMDEQAREKMDSALDRTTLDEKAQDAFKEHGDKLDGVVDQHADRIDKGIDQAGDFVDQRTGGKFGDQIDAGGDRLRDTLDGLDGKDDDFGNAADAAKKG